MKARIQIIEEQLNSAPQLSLEEKTALENALAEEKADKAKHLEDKQAAQADLIQAKEQITLLESENNNLTGTVTSL